MACNVNIKAANGQNSILFKSIATTVENPNDAIDLYYYTKTDVFKKMYGDWESGDVDSSLLDANGEPKYSSLNSDGYLDDVDFSRVELDSKAEVYKNLIEMVPKMEDTIQRQINYLEASKSSPKTLRKLKALKEALGAKSIDESIPKFLAMAGRHVRGLLKGMNEEIAKVNPDIRVLASMYKISKAYNIANQLQADIQSDPTVASIFPEDMFETSKTAESLAQIEAIYMKQAEHLLIEEFHKRDKSWSKDDIRKWLKESPRDVKVTEEYLEYMGDSQDKVLSMIANIVMEAEHNKRHMAIDFNQRLQERLEALEQANKGKSAEDMFADAMYTDSETGEIHVLNTDVEFTNGENKAEDAMYNRVQKLKNSNRPLYDFLIFYNEEYRALQAMLGHTSGSQMGTRIPTVLKGTFERMQGKTLKDKYKLIGDEIKKTIERSNLDMERGAILDNDGVPVKRIPTFFTQRYDSRDFTPIYEKRLAENLEAGMNADDAHTDADAYATQEAVKKTSETITRDLAYGLQAFHAMATNFGTKNQVLHVLDAAQAVVSSRGREYTLVDSGGRTFLEKGFGMNNNKATITGEGSRAAKVLEQFMDTKVYGITESDLSYFEIAGYKLDWNKTLRGLNKSTSMIQLAGNLAAGLANIGNGVYNSWMEAVGGEFYGVKQYRKAGGFYRNNLPGIMKDIGARNPTHIIGLLDQHYNMMQEFQDKGNIKASEQSKAKRLMNSSLLFFINNSGEHYMQMRASLAVMESTKTFDKNGKEVGTLLEAHSVKNGKLNIADVYVKDTNGKLVKFDQAQQNRISNKMNALNRKMFGNYNQHTANKMKQDARLALLIKFRDWAYEGLVRRWGKKQHYRQLEAEMEGMYITTGRVAKDMAKHLKGFRIDLMKADWQKLTPHEKANIRRTVTEAAALTVLSISGAMLGHAGKMMDEEYGSDSTSDRFVLGSYKLLVYEVNRLYTELFTYINPKEALRLMQSPAASSTLIESTFKLLEQLGDPFERYETGWRKDELKILARVEKLVPLYKQIKTLNPDGIEDRGVFYKF